MTLITAVEVNGIEKSSKVITGKISKGNQIRDIDEVLDCVDAMYTEFGYFSFALTVASIADPGIALAVVGFCLTALQV